jgi:hypothetical protein
MTEVPLPIRHIYAGDIRRERYRCEPCGVTATVEIVFEVDERSAEPQSGKHETT